MMRSDAYLVNTSRAGIVDVDALIRAVESGAIAGAALDVFDYEPLPADHPLRNTKGILATPHIGYVTRETYEVFYGEMVDAIAGYLRER
jgi:phosphoglycerate dehydrogenase-like enzyme